MRNYIYMIQSLINYGPTSTREGSGVPLRMKKITRNDLPALARPMAMVVMLGPGMQVLVTRVVRPE